MIHALKLYLIVTGIGATLVMLFPTLVVIGLFLFIVPGLRLSLLPAAFLWGAAFAILWLPLQYVLGPWIASAIAIPAVVASFWFAATPGHEQGLARLASVDLPDILPKDRIALRGHVRIDVQFAKLDTVGRGRNTKSRIRCDGLCAAALFTRGVESVTLTSWQRANKPKDYVFGGEPLASYARTFRVVSKADCVGPSETLATSGIDRALEAEIALKLSTTDCIVSDPPRTAYDMQLTIGEYWLYGEGLNVPDWSLGPRRVRVEHLELRGRAGQTLLRRMIAASRVLSRPLFPFGGGEGDFTAYRFGWARAERSSRGRVAQLGAHKLLAKHTDLRLTADGAVVAVAARERLRTLLANPAIPSGDPGFALPEMVFASIRENGLGAGDGELVTAIVADLRTRQLNDVWAVIRALGTDAAMLRAPIVSRLAVGGADRDADRTLGRALRTLPPGVFAHPTPQELALLADPARRENAEGLIMRQANRGPAVAPFLLDILADIFRRRALVGKQSGPALERDTLDAIRYALGVLGPEIAAQRPRLEALLAAQPGLEGRVRTWHWEVTLVRMGASPDSFQNPARSAAARTSTTNRCAGMSSGSSASWQAAEPLI